ncbi:DUF1156 domain-containing protein [Pseudidiomarina sp. 1ASP75-14]|uniref:anti-phage-associated DUF1156 domain-containing protein n=1 Tax=Pseudidiomarina terrestris TaxID=2820060 RepID=UPI002650EF0C|nr:anti-phage-associated DUF1156 domain-containing protein [Pseudidiomarina sp. 1ASP75-14]MDN7138070.1 DUF1156 domain-containing protein [Pseudidiomarina sp. 1ASP75-14]
MENLTPFRLKDEPALIEAVFPAQKISYEAQAERKAVAAQTLTGLGSYWKGRKPLILVRAIILGSLLPQTDDRKKDLEIFEMLMGFDNVSLAKRALISNTIRPAQIAQTISLSNPWKYFSHNISKEDPKYPEVRDSCLPIKSDNVAFKLKWQRGMDESDKVKIISLYLETLSTYEEKASLCKRPEEVNQEWLSSHIWDGVNNHLSFIGVSATSINSLVEQLGILRFGHRPQVGDAFCGGGSIPFEAARVGCHAYASDLNPIACMLTWGAFNIVGGELTVREEIEQVQQNINERIDQKIKALGIENNENGDRAKAYLYCVEVTCPETGWKVPLSPSWVISPKQKTIAILEPDYETKSFKIIVESGVSNQALREAEKGTVQSSNMVFSLDGKTYRTPIKTLRGDYRTPEGISANKLRKWGVLDFKPREDDIFRERLYAIQWIKKESVNSPRQSYFFTGVSPADLELEKAVDALIKENIENWQVAGLVSNMEIETGYNTEQPIRERGWTHWHHLYNPRQLLLMAMAKKEWLSSPFPQFGMLNIAKMADFNARLSRWKPSQGGGLGGPVGVFSNQALNTFFNYATRSWAGYGASSFKIAEQPLGSDIQRKVFSVSATEPKATCDFWITDPPYADAVNYHEITEFFIAWLRKNPPAPFDEWTWDSRRALAIKGNGDEFRRSMSEAYSALRANMPDNGMQCVMFTHQDTRVWSDMIGIFWSAGLQVIGAWYIATETTSELKKGGYVQGTVILMLRKRPESEKSGFKQRLLPAVRAEVEQQIRTMLNLNTEIESMVGESVFNDSDLQMAGYAAALKVLTSYTHIGGEDVRGFALRPRQKGEVTVVDEIVQQAAEAANSLLVPDGLQAGTWQKLSGIQRFYLRMMDIETTGASKLDNYQNFAKAFRVEDYTRVMSSLVANKAKLKEISEFSSRDLADSTEIGATWLGSIIIAIQQLQADVEPQVAIIQLRNDLPDFLEARPVLLDILQFIERKAPEQKTRDAAEVLGSRFKNMRAIGD